MKAFLASSLAALLLLSVHAAPKNAINALSKLIGEVHDELEQEKVAGEKLYSREACKCADFAFAKADAIDVKVGSRDGKHSSYEQKKGEISQLEAAIKGQESEIEKAETANAEATELRAKQKKTFEELEAEAKEAVAALTEAVAILTKEPAMLQKTVKLIPASLKLTQKQRALLQTPDKMVDVASVAAVLKELQSGQEERLATLASQENLAIENYGSLIESNDSLIASATANKAQKVSEKLETEAEQATLTVEIDTINKELELLTISFEQNDESCRLKATDWQSELETLTAQLDDLKEAKGALEANLEQLNVPELTTPFSFIQLDDAAEAEEGSAAFKAHAILLQGARKTHSTVLSELATRVKSLAGGEDTIETAITFVKQVLEESEIARVNEISAHTSCLSRLGEYELEKGRLKGNKELSEKKVTQLIAREERLQEEIDAVQGELEELENEENSAKAMRSTEQSQYESRKLELGNALQALQSIDQVFVPKPDCTAGAKDPDRRCGILHVLANLQASLSSSLTAAAATEEEEISEHTAKLATWSQQNNALVEEESELTEERQQAVRAKGDEETAQLGWGDDQLLNEPPKTEANALCSEEILGFAASQEKRTNEIEALTAALSTLQQMVGATKNLNFLELRK